MSGMNQKELENQSGIAENAPARDGVIRIKYPRTYHVPWSPGATSDDKIIKDLSHFVGKEVVVTVKMDGENTTIYKDYIHARSVDYSPHPSRSLVRAFQSQIGPDIPEGWRLCGENLYAKHSIKYKHLDDFFLIFSIWNKENFCLSWEETEDWAHLLGLKMVPVLYRGLWDEKLFRGLYSPKFREDDCEGYVIRIAGPFSYEEFNNSVVKYVRANHVQTDQHWSHGEIEPNEIS